MTEIAPSSLTDELRTAIIAGRYLPGERLAEQTLAHEFNVSRNTLRESFQALTQQGLLRRVPNRGVSVAAPTMSDVVDIYRVRRVIELGVLANANSTHPAASWMREALEQAQQCRADEDWAGVGTANMRFHESLVALADSPRLSRQFTDLLAQLRLAFLLLHDPKGLHLQFIDWNVRVFDALAAGNAASASAELRAYLADSERLLLSAYTRLGLT